MIYGLDLFSGIGGISIGLQEWIIPIAYCEIEPYCQSVLLQRMQEGNLPKAPIWDDVRTLSENTFQNVDIIYGGFPCQDISIAGHKKGLEGKRSGLIFEIFRLLDETKAPFLFLENVPNIRTKGAERICKELAERGYDSRWCCLSASDVGARHQRKRWFLLAYSESVGREAWSNENIQSEEQNTGREKFSSICKNVSNSECERLERQSNAGEETYSKFRNGNTITNDWTTEPDICRVVNGLPHRVDRIKALGNSVVPLQVREAFKILIGIK